MPLKTIARTATISEDGRYRYDLTRTWDVGLEPRRRRAMFIMLNPSTADAEVDDPTIRRCMGFADREGCDSLVVVNLYAFRTSKPAILWAERDVARTNIVGPMNMHTISRHASIARMTGAPIIAAWGAGLTKDDDGQAMLVLELLSGMTDNVYCLGKTAAGHPRHPLYVRGDAPLVAFP